MTRVFGVIGYPIEHSLSPAMHMAAFRALGLDAIYAPFAIPPRDVTRMLDGLAASGVAGLNVTVPHKETVLRYLHRHGQASAEARLIGAVNTLSRAGSQFLGANTDVIGIQQVLTRELHLRAPAPRRVLVLGAGGAARAVLWALKASRFRAIYLANRTRARAVSLAQWARRAGVKTAITVIPWDLAARSSCGREAELIINATSVGLHRGDPALLAPSAFPSRLAVFDLVYRAPTTALVQQARRRGALAVDGIPMLVYQGAESFRLWWHREPPVAVMRRAVEDSLRARKRGGA